jgi:hypothetical protein
MIKNLKIIINHYVLIHSTIKTTYMESKTSPLKKMHKVLHYLNNKTVLINTI